LISSTESIDHIEEGGNNYRGGNNSNYSANTSYDGANTSDPLDHSSAPPSASTSAGSQNFERHTVKTSSGANHSGTNTKEKGNFNFFPNVQSAPNGGKNKNVVNISSGNKNKNAVVDSITSILNSTATTGVRNQDPRNVKYLYGSGENKSLESRNAGDTTSRSDEQATWLAGSTSKNAEYYYRGPGDKETDRRGTKESIVLAATNINRNYSKESIANGQDNSSKKDQYNSRSHSKESNYNGNSKETHREMGLKPGGDKPFAGDANSNANHNVSSDYVSPFAFEPMNLNFQ
jgi:hypothetical protein